MRTVIVQHEPSSIKFRPSSCHGNILDIKKKTIRTINHNIITLYSRWTQLLEDRGLDYLTNPFVSSFNDRLEQG